MKEVEVRAAEILTGRLMSAAVLGKSALAALGHHAAHQTPRGWWGQGRTPGEDQ